MGRLDGKVALVTGAAQGIGQAISELFIDQGAAVIATDVQPVALARDVGTGATYRLDVASERDWGTVVSEAVQRHGRIDVLVNNAGTGGSGEAIAELSVAAWDKVIAVSQTGVFLGMREVIPHMRRSGGGAIVNFSSIWGNAAIPGLAAYHAAKGAVRNLTKNAAVSYAPDNIRVNSVHPVFIDTPLTRANPPAVNEAIIAAQPVGRGGQAAEVAYAVLFLASDESSFVTGAELAVDGGYLAR
jgi:NAD(P)-dependent dehydrogenase (short-subunit alcohol dehydrogenase family)